MSIAVNRNSDWTLEEIQVYLRNQVSPLRLAVSGGDFPLICSLWFEFDEAGQQLLCASHKSSALVKKLQVNKRCAFEIATNEPPYKGVRGVGYVELTQTDVDKVLPRLSERFLGRSNRKLVDWLNSRYKDEFLLRVTPLRISAWDYSSRMSGKADETA
jgi:hypothetical protein